MAFEIERRFLLDSRNLGFLEALTPLDIQQGYLHESGMTSRIRIAGEQAWLTLKGKAKGAVKPEFEYEIPLEDARLLMKNAVNRIIEKRRYTVRHGRHCWDVDIFGGHLNGLAIAEVELQEEFEAVAIPPWAGPEITGVKALSNRNLSKVDELPQALLRKAA